MAQMVGGGGTRQLGSVMRPIGGFRASGGNLVTMGEEETVAVDVNSDLDMMDVLKEDLVEEETVAWVEDMVAEMED